MKNLSKKAIDVLQRFYGAVLTPSQANAVGVFDCGGMIDTLEKSGHLKVVGETDSEYKFCLTAKGNEAIGEQEGEAI